MSSGAPFVKGGFAEGFDWFSMRFNRTIFI
jgi:hypothetical protein